MTLTNSKKAWLAGLTLLALAVSLAGCAASTDADSIPVVGAERSTQSAAPPPSAAAAEETVGTSTTRGIGMTEAQFQSLFNTKVAALDPSLEIQGFEPRQDQPGRGATLNPNVAIALNSNREGDLIVVALAARNDVPDLKPGQNAISAFLVALAPEGEAGRILDSLKQGHEAIAGDRRFRLDEGLDRSTLTVTNKNVQIEERHTPTPVIVPMPIIVHE